MGQPNRHNGHQPRDYWLSNEEREKIVEFYRLHREDGYRRCAYMMIDEDVAYASPATVYRVLRDAEVLRHRVRGSTKKGSGFDQPTQPHEHWHMDISYVKIGDRFYFLICVLDGFSRSIIHWDLRNAMKDEDVGVVQQASMEKHPDAHPRFITDNGSQFTGNQDDALRHGALLAGV